MNGDIFPIWPGRLDGNTVHLWLIETGSVTVPDELCEILSPVELARVERLSPVYRNHYRLQRIMMRMLIGRYLNIEAVSILFGTVSNGKPCLTGILRDTLYFNVSDTGGALAIGFTTDGPIGVDMELPGRAINTSRLARRICAVNERPMIASLPSEEQRLAILRLWVRKEALLKGLGHGLRTPMRLLTVGGESPVPAIFDPAVPDVGPDDRWYVTDINCDVPYMISIALPFLPGSLTVIRTSPQNLIDQLTGLDA